MKVICKKPRKEPILYYKSCIIYNVLSRQRRGKHFNSINVKVSNKYLLNFLNVLIKACKRRSIVRSFKIWTIELNYEKIFDLWVLGPLSPHFSMNEKAKIVQSQKIKGVIKWFEKKSVLLYIFIPKFTKESKTMSHLFRRLTLISFQVFL